MTRYRRLRPRPRVRATQSGRRDYCGPTAFPGVHDLLYRNAGGGRFVDVQPPRPASPRSRTPASASSPPTSTTTVGPISTSPTTPTPTTSGSTSATAPSSTKRCSTAPRSTDSGTAEAGMGVVAGDADGDADLDLFVTNLIEETNTYYRNLGAAGFEDATASVGLGAGTMDLTGFGVALFDLENDGDLDAAVVNGAVKRRPSPLGRLARRVLARLRRAQPPLHQLRRRHLPRGGGGSVHRYSGRESQPGRRRPRHRRRSRSGDDQRSTARRASTATTAAIPEAGSRSRWSTQRSVATRSGPR